jgi:hypothetical protein
MPTETSLGTKSGTKRPQRVRARIRTSDGISHCGNVTGEKDTTAGEEGRQISTHVEDICTSFDGLRNCRYAITGNVAMVGERVQSRASSSLVGGLGVLVGIRRLWKLLQASDGGGEEVVQGVAVAAGGLSLVKRIPCIFTSFSSVEVCEELFFLLDLLAVEIVDERGKLRVSLDGL